jgi:hypothetical protein
MNRLESIKDQAINNNKTLKGVYSDDHLKERLAHILRMIDGPVYATAHNKKINEAYTGKWDSAQLWTISASPDQEGWETDSGCSGYGLYPEVAEYYAMCINEYPKLLQRLEKCEKAILVTTTRMAGLIQEYQKLNKITDDSISLSNNIINEVQEALKE